MNKVAVYGGLKDLPKPYEEIFRDASIDSGVFMSLSWFRHLATTVFEQNNRFRIYGIESGGPGKPSLALPMCHAASRKGLFGPRRLMPLANYYTPLFGPVAGSSSRVSQEELNLLAEAIASERPRWDMIDIHPMQVDSPLFKGMLSAFHQAGMLAKTYFCFGNWYLPVNGRSYREYFESLPSKLKNTVTRKRKQLESAGRLRIEIVSSTAGLPAALSVYDQIYRSSWKKPESHPAFVQGLIRIGAEEGWLRLGIAYVDGQPAAAQLWMVDNGVASIYKLAYDERFSKLSVGSILTAQLMQHVIDVDRVREVDYLSGDDSYKRDWMPHRRERHGIVAFNPRTLYGALAALRHAGGRVFERIKLGSAVSRAQQPQVT
jgi:hypothetical protein